MNLTDKENGVFYLKKDDGKIAVLPYFDGFCRDLQVLCRMGRGCVLGMEIPTKRNNGYPF